MDPIAVRERAPPWQQFKLFRRVVAPHSLNLYPAVQTHECSAEETALHEFRNRINEYELSLTDGKNWEYYKKVVNPYELIYTQNKYEDFPESICFLKPLSRSYFKMVEMLDLTNFLQQIKSEYVRAAHVCEGPGGFIEALFDEAFKKKKKIQTSIAMTLKSKQSNIPGWKRAASFLQANRSIKILYGDDDTGDILKPENQQYFIDYCTNPTYGGKMDIFTADGGFDFSCNYLKQEEMIFSLLLASTKIGFEVLKRGGVFILKMFDFYHKNTTDLLYLLSLHFQEWTLYKPATSRPCNPEQYFIGKGFTGASDEVLDYLRLWCLMISANYSIDSLFTSEYSADFTNIITQLRTNSFKTQTEYLEKVFQLIDSKSPETIKHFLRQNERASYDWCVRFKVPIYAARFHSIVGSRSDPRASYQ